MSETYILVTTVTGTWTKEETRQQPASWIRPPTNIDNTRSAIDSLLVPLLCRNDLWIVLTEVETSAFVDDVTTPWLANYIDKNTSAMPTTDPVTNPIDYLGPAHPLLLISLAHSSNSPEGITAVELVNQFVPERYHLPITCNEADNLYQNAVASDNTFVLLMPVETHDRGFAMTSSITAMMASCLAVFTPGKINSQIFRDVADRCQTTLTLLGGFNDGVLDSEPWRRIVHLDGGGLQGAVRKLALKVPKLTADKLAAFYDSPIGFHHDSKSLVDNETLVAVFVSSYLYTRQYDLDLLAELRCNRQALRVVVIAVQAHEVIEADPHILLPPARSFIDMELTFCFLVYAQIFALTRSINIGNASDTPSASGIVNRTVQGVVIYPWNI